MVFTVWVLDVIGVGGWFAGRGVWLEEKIIIVGWVSRWVWLNNLFGGKDWLPHPLSHVY